MIAEVIVVGAGPAGLMLAGELALAGVEVAVLERRETPGLVGTRAGGFHSRTLEILDQRGIADRFLEAGEALQTAFFGMTALDISGFPTRHPYGLALWQNQIEPLLAEWIDELGVRVEFAREAVGMTQDDAGVDVHLADGAARRARYVVGADGGRSTIRRAAGIGFPGWDATRSNLIAEVEVTEQPPSGVRRDEAGVHGLQPLADGRTYRVITTEHELHSGAAPTLANLKRALTRVFGTDFGVHSPVWLSRFTDATRQAAQYRNGRVLLVGDAAHIHYPAGGQGIGLGIQDAVNLGFKLAQVVHGISPETLLDTYTEERHPADARALQLSMAQTALQRADPRSAALADTIGDLLAVPDAHDVLAARVHGLDVAYDLGGAHPLVGRRMPDLDLSTAEGSVRVYELLRDGRPVVLRLTDAGEARGTPRARVVRAAHDGAWELPLLGAVEDPGDVFLRPDGHVAWVSRGAHEPLTDALARWGGA